jgi:FlaA1/EpsC-like NDP-sugar epimerase
LVTGAGGFIGSRLSAHAAYSGASEITLLDTSEPDLFWTDRYLDETETIDVRPVLGSVRDDGLVRALLDETLPEVIFHTAAYKHVGLVERNPLAAITTNVLGTRVLARAAADAGVDCLIAISSDKAVEPEGTMGFTKKVAEKIVSSAIGSIRATSVRFGNVIGSSGSFLQVLERDWAQRRRIEVRDERARRFFVSSGEVVQLLETVAAIAGGGGGPRRILDLAVRFLESKGCVDPMAAIRVTSLLPGEKIDEQLWSGKEPEPTPYPGIRVVREPVSDRDRLNTYLDEIEKACRDRNEAVALSLLNQAAGL